MAAADIAAALRGHRFHCDNEAQLQTGIAMVLDLHRVPYVRELALGAADRPDFIAGESQNIVIEVKVAGTRADTYFQLRSYALYEQVKELILVTACRHHDSIALKKPLFIVALEGK